MNDARTEWRDCLGEASTGKIMMHDMIDYPN